MTPYELLYSSLRPFDHPMHQHIHRVLKRETLARKGGKVSVLDVGGRTSNYTIGIDADICISELPRETSIQESLKLGANAALIKKVQKRRSNIKRYEFDDLTKTKFEPNTFDILTAIEVIEHVFDDEVFVRNMRTVLSDQGVAIITTPNGDFVTNRNPDHYRHYKKVELERLLAKYFSTVDVGYTVVHDRYFSMGRRKWSLRRPIRTISSFYGNFINSRRAPYEKFKAQSQGTLHLFAVARC